MSRFEAIVYGTIVGLMMCLGLVLWVQGEEMPTPQSSFHLEHFEADGSHLIEGFSPNRAGPDLVMQYVETWSKP